MKLNSIVFKLGGMIILLFLVLLLPMGFVINQIVTGSYQHHVNDQNRQLSERYAKALSDQVITVNKLKTIAQFSDVKFMMLDQKGNVVSSAGFFSRVQGLSLPYQEIAPVLKGKSISLNYAQLLTATRFIGYGSPIVHSDKVTGGIFVFSALDGMQQSVHNVQKLLFLTGIGAFFLAVGFTFVLSKKLSLPLIRMEQATRTIAKGNLDSHAYIHSNDELGSLGQAINDLALELKQYQDNRNEFFANVSHDLRTPLTYVQGYAHVLNNKLYQSEEEQAHYLSLIAQETHRLTHLIEDLFELSKIEEGKDRLDLEWIDLREVMGNVIEQCRFTLKEQEIDLHHRYDATLSLFYGDGLRMERIFTNLLANSIRYTMEGSITVQISQCDNKLLISIEDTGIGIPEDQLPYVFDRFYRVEQSRSRLHGGSGLGLSIVKKLVELHGGTVSIQSKMNIGTRVEVEFIVQASTAGGLEE